MTNIPNLDIELEDIPKLPFAELKALYNYLIGGDTASTRKSFYIMRVTHRLQELRFGALDSKTRELLENYTTAQENQAPKTLPIGAEIVKKFKGKIYRLRIVDGGYELDGVFYKSLSGAALAITGRKIYGQSFFGLS